MAKPRKPTKTDPDRIAQLEDELEQRDLRIRELSADLTKAEALIEEERAHRRCPRDDRTSWI